MAGSINKPRKPKSKRTTVRLRHKIEKASAAKQRKLRKKGKKSTEWRSHHKKDLGIPNSYPYKQELLEEIDQINNRMREEAQKRKEASKAAATGAGAGDAQPNVGAPKEEGIEPGKQAEAEEAEGPGGDSSDDEMDDEGGPEDGPDNSANPMAALLASARRAADKYQRDLEGRNRMDADDDDEDEDEDDDVGEDDDGAKPNAPQSQSSSRKQYDKVFKEVIDQADVVLYVLDARDPEGTRSRDVERTVLGAASGGKRLILILNKIDLVPEPVLRGWLAHLRRSFPTLPLRASTSAPGAFGFSHGELTAQKTCGDLFRALKAFSASRNLKRAISVGVAGYPNVGKSSVINALLGRMGGKGSSSASSRRRACPAGAEAGVTTSIRAVKIDSKLTLLDSPGIVFPSTSSESDGRLVSLKHASEEHARLVLLNALPPKQIDDPVPAVSLLLRRLSGSPDLMKGLADTYGLPPLLSVSGDATTDFLVQVARRRGRLGRGGVPNLAAAAMSVLADWRDGRIRGWVEAPAAGAGGPGSGPDEKVVVTEWAEEFKIEGLWGDGAGAATDPEGDAVMGDAAMRD